MAGRRINEDYRKFVRLPEEGAEVRRPEDLADALLRDVVADESQEGTKDVRREVLEPDRHRLAARTAEHADDRQRDGRLGEVRAVEPDA